MTEPDWRAIAGELAQIVTQVADGIDARWEHAKAENPQLLRHPAEELLVKHLRDKARVALVPQAADASGGSGPQAS